MPSREFPHVPMSEYPLYAARFQESCIHWQQVHRIALPSRSFLSSQFGMPNVNTFTLIFDGRSLPSPSLVLSIARACAESVEEHLLVLNMDLAKRGRPPVDTFASLMRFAEYHRMRRAADVLQATQEEAWMEQRTRWHDSAEKTLVTNIPPDQKIDLIVQIIEIIQNASGHAPSHTPGHQRLARA